MANSTAGTPLGTAVGAVLYGLANLFAQHPQVAAIGYSLYTLTEIAPYVFPDYNTTAAKIKSFASYPQVSDQITASDPFQSSTSEILAETPTVLVIESAVTSPIQRSTTPENTASVDSSTNSTSAKSEPTTIATKTATLESELHEASDERIENMTPETPHQTPTTSGSTTVESDFALPSASGTALESEVPAITEESISNEEQVDVEEHVMTEETVDTENNEQIKNDEHIKNNPQIEIEEPVDPEQHCNTEHNFNTKQHLKTEQQVEKNEQGDNLVHVSFPQVPTISTAAATEPEQATVEEAHDRQDVRGELDTHVPDDEIVNTTNRSTDSGYVLSAVKWLTNKIFTINGFLAATADTPTALDSSSPPPDAVPFPSGNAHVTQNTAFHKTDLFVPELVHWSKLHDLSLAPDIFAFLFLAGLLMWFGPGTRSYRELVQSTNRVTKDTAAVCWQMMKDFVHGTWLELLNIAQRTTRGAKHTAAKGWQVSKDFVYRSSKELLVLSLAMSIILVAKCGPHVVATLRPYFTFEMLRWVFSQIKLIAKSGFISCIEACISVIVIAEYAFVWCTNGLNTITSMIECTLTWCSEQWDNFIFTTKEAIISYSKEWHIVKSWTSDWTEETKSNYMNHWRSVYIHSGRRWHSFKDAAIVATQSAATQLEARVAEYVPPFVSMTCRPRWFWLVQGDMIILFSATFVGFFLFFRQSDSFVRALIVLLWALSFGLPELCTGRFRDFVLTVVGASFLASLFLIEWRKFWEMLKAWTTSAATLSSHTWSGLWQAYRTVAQCCSAVWRSCWGALRACTAFLQRFVPVLLRMCWTAIRTVLDFINPHILAVGRKCRVWLTKQMTSAWETCKSGRRSFERKFRGVLGIHPESDTSLWAFCMGNLGEALGVGSDPIDNPVEEPTQKSAQEPEKASAQETEPEPVRETEREPVHRFRQAACEDEELPETGSIPTSSHDTELLEPKLPKYHEVKPTPRTVGQLNDLSEVLLVAGRRAKVMAEYEKEDKQRAQREKEREQKEQEDSTAVITKAAEEYAKERQKPAVEALRAARIEEEMEEERKTAAAELAECEKRIAEAERKDAEVSKKLAASLLIEAQMGMATAGTGERTTPVHEATDLSADQFPLPDHYDRAAGTGVPTTFGHQATDLDADDFPPPDLYNRQNVARLDTGVSSKADWQDRLLGGPSILMKMRDQQAAQNNSSSGPAVPPTAGPSDAPAPSATAPSTTDNTSNDPQAHSTPAQDTIGDSANGPQAPSSGTQDATKQAPEPDVNEMDGVQETLLQDQDWDVDMDGGEFNSEVASAQAGQVPYYADEVVMGGTREARAQPPATEAPRTKASQTQDPAPASAPQVQDPQTQAPQTEDPQAQESQVHDYQFHESQVLNAQVQDPQNQVADDNINVQDAFPLSKEYVHDSDDSDDIDDEDFYGETDTAPTAPANLPSLPDTPDQNLVEHKYDSDEDQEWQNALYNDPGAAATQPAPTEPVTKSVTKHSGPFADDSESEDEHVENVTPKPTTLPAAAEPIPSITVTKPTSKSRPAAPYQQPVPEEDFVSKLFARKDATPSSEAAVVKPTATTPAATKWSATKTPSAKSSAAPSTTPKPPAAKPAYFESLLAEAAAGSKPLPTAPTKPSSTPKISLADYTARKSPTYKPPTQPLDAFPVIPATSDTDEPVVRRPARTKPASRPEPTKSACLPLMGTHGVDEFSGDEDEEDGKEKKDGDGGSDSGLSEADDALIKVYETEETMNGAAKVAAAKWGEGMDLSDS